MQTVGENALFNEKTCVAIGCFDGVHRGHAAVISAAVDEAKRRAQKSVALTFDMSKKRAKGKGAHDLITFSEKERLIAALGADYLCVLDFSDICDLCGEEFVSEILSKRLSASAVFCGEGFRFSKNKSCGTAELKELCAAEGIDTATVAEVCDGGVISTTRIKALAEAGAVGAAARLLGHPLIYTGSVKKGRMLARRLGFPTANVRYPDGVIRVRFGVYRTRAYADGRTYEAISNIGVRPTVDNTREVFIETFLIEYEGDLYDKEVSVELIRFIRDEKRFSDETELRAAVLADIEEVKREIAAERTQKEQNRQN